VRGERLSDGEVLRTGATTLRVVATPGHTSDSCSLLVEGPDGARWLLSGDTVLGRGTSVIASPDGHLGDYLRSLERLAALVAEHRVREILPGHGPRVADPAERLAGYQRHRFERLAQVRAALAAGDRTAEQVVARVYADVDRAVWPAALQSVRAQLLYLAESIAEPATIDVDDFEGEGFQPR
jgi:glyoxylase-like metal-dependent hydrolase (beta-lactamase superfamily II)